jgi:S1-C subfamily serine protease
MFVPIDRLKPILTDLIATGRPAAPPRPWLGINVEESHGRVLVRRITAEGPAEQAGFQVGDLILKVGQQDVEGLAVFYRKVWALGVAGVAVPLQVLQGTHLRAITVHSADRYQYLRLRPQQ